jgi:hypothetical protein
LCLGGGGLGGWLWLWLWHGDDVSWLGHQWRAVLGGY